jgi:hypothetical protein
MKITVENTSTVDTIQGQTKARIWKGTTDSGIPVVVWISVIQPQMERDDERHAQFVKELQEIPDAKRQVAYYDITGII